MKFSQRYGITSPPQKLSMEAMPDQLRAGLWNAVRATFLISDFEEYNYLDPRLSALADSIWGDHFKEPTDSYPDRVNRLTFEIRSRFFEFKWYEVYDFIEFLTNEKFQGGLFYPIDNVSKFAATCNDVLAREMALVRFVNLKLTTISDEQEIVEIETATSSPHAPIAEHFKQALAFLSDRKSPDYKNSIKESISGVEAAAKFATGDSKATLGQALGQLEKNRELHTALAKGFKNLYGWTSDKSGIRHALMDGDTDLSQDDARYMLVSCSAFANYLIASKAD
ncbi:hypothetical protein SAMN06273572_102320 [Monaibacterium marinum]|uniref:HEPN AbiJ-N-terminal domain-containing protein n=1 Tax=Pontivivens marinum TaxID=1690039 RepID=A0A2C9CQW9_9RHOB|nr:hypothetical protein [Monaibacterium marinum]SOH93642.1 hypothetical protein SAMN06273572_102320 [Monaibacterium marinum]